MTLVRGDDATLRTATERDIDAVSRIEAVAFTDPWSRSAFASLIGHGHVHFLVADLTFRGRAELVGYAIAWGAADEAEIANIAVAPSVRGLGVGARLLDAMLGALSQGGATAVYLEVRESNEAARRLYASRGFAEVGRRRNYYRRPQEDALVLRREGAAATTHDGQTSAMRSI